MQVVHVKVLLARIVQVLHAKVMPVRVAQVLHAKVMPVRVVLNFQQIIFISTEDFNGIT
jgi:hypothetical protein